MKQAIIEKPLRTKAGEAVRFYPRRCEQHPQSSFTTTSKRDEHGILVYQTYCSSCAKF